jgi:3-oxoacyl-[acyl-carrier protein] reductase
VDLGLEGKRALVTGSSRGIGLGIAEVFLAEGATVALNGRDRDALEGVRARLADRHGAERVRAIAGDAVGTEPAIESVVDKAVAGLGGLEILVANVGSGRGLPGLDSDEAEWMRMLRLNLVGAALAARHAIPRIRDAGGGAVLFVGSIAGLTALPAPLPYSAAKAGLTALAANLARAHARDGVRVNVLAPGNVLHDGGTWARKLEADPDGTRRYVEENVPAARFGTPDDMGRAAAFLVSDLAAGFVTGTTLVADGGQRDGW